MWRSFDQPAALPDTPDPLPSKPRPGGPRAPSHRYELLLIPSAAGLRGALLEVAALIGSPIDPGPECITDLPTPLTSGGDRADATDANPVAPSQGGTACR